MKEEEIEKLFYEYGERVYRTAFGILKNESDAKDVVQEVFVGLYNNFRSSKVKNIGAYLGSCGAKKAIDFLRKNKRENLFKKEYGRDDIERESIWEENIESIRGSEESLAGKIKEQIERLSEKYRIILSLRLLEEYDYHEIAEITGLNENTIRSNYMRGRVKLIESLKKEKIL